MRIRLDAALVKRGLATTRSEASRMIEAGHVTVSGAFADKASRLVGADEPIAVVVEKRYVSRGGEKLEKALDVFGVSVAGRSVMDVGVSTGGFTDCLLQRGAERVFAFDVGTNQLHEKIKSDSRVTWRDGVNVRHLTPEDMPFPCSLAVADVSFISLTKVLPVVFSLLTPERSDDSVELLLLVKPQFEAGRKEVSKGKGVITDPMIHAQTVSDIEACVVGLGGEVVGVIESPIKGAEGNTEFLMFAKCHSSSVGCSS